MRHYTRYVEQFKAMSAAIAKRQFPDGFWRPNLDDPDQVPFPESSGTGFHCYAMTWGINRGILDRATYEPVVRKAWNALAGAVGPDGKVQWGQPVGDQPANVKESLTHEYVTGTFLLAGSEIYRLVGGKQAAPGRTVRSLDGTWQIEDGKVPEPSAGTLTLTLETKAGQVLAKAESAFSMESLGATDLRLRLRAPDAPQEDLILKAAASQTTGKPEAPTLSRRWLSVVR